MTEISDKLGLGSPVVIRGYVVGRSDWQKGQSTYCVEFDQKGKPQREWFHADEIETEDVAEGGGI